MFPIKSGYQSIPFQCVILSPGIIRFWLRLYIWIRGLNFPVDIDNMKMVCEI